MAVPVAALAHWVREARSEQESVLAGFLELALGAHPAQVEERPPE